MKAAILFVEQRSPDMEVCSRCDLLDRPARLWPGTRFLALLEDEEEMDRPPRVILCQECAVFVRSAIGDEPPPGE